MKKRNHPKAFLLPLLVLFTMILKAQEKGFFAQFDEAACGVGSLELDDGSFIVAAYDFHHEWYSYHDSTPAQLFHLSPEGQLIDRIPMSTANRRSTITGLYSDPETPNLFYAVGKIRSDDNLCDKPYLAKFNENLEVLSFHEIELPEQIPYFYMGNSIMDSSGDIVFFTISILGGSLNTNGFVYMRIGRSGDLLSYYRDTTHLTNNNDEGSLCEILDGSGNFIHLVLSHETNAWEIRKMDRNFNPLESIPFNDSFEIQTNQNNGSASLYNPQYVTMQSAGGDSLWISSQSLIPLLLSNNDYEALLWYKTDLHGHSGNIVITNSGGNMVISQPNMLMIGFGNDTFEAPARMKSFAISLSDGDLIHCNGAYYESAYGSRIIVTKANSSLEKVRWIHTLDLGVFVEPMFVMATHDGGCLITGYSNVQNTIDRKFCALRLNADGVWNTNEHLARTLPFAFFPNPVNDQLHLEFSPDVQPRTMELYDIQGRLVRSQGKGFESIDMSELPTGTYALRIAMEDGTCYSDKVVKQ